MFARHGVRCEIIIVEDVIVGVFALDGEISDGVFTLADLRHRIGDIPLNGQIRAVLPRHGVSFRLSVDRAGKFRYAVVFRHRKIDCIHALREHGRIVALGHFHEVVEVCILRIGAEALPCHDEDDEGNDHGKTCAEHAVAALFLQFEHLLVVHLLVVRILFLQLFELGLHLLHDEILFSRHHALVDVERQRDRLEDEVEHDDADAHDADALDDDTGKMTEPVEPDLIPRGKDHDVRHCAQQR